MKKGMNKKGAEMTIGTIIIIVLALVVLVVLIFGFSTGWTNLWGKIIGFGGGEVNVQSIVQSCQLACTTGSTYDWCTKTRTLVIDDPDNPGRTITKKNKKCYELIGVGYGLDQCFDIRCEKCETGNKGVCDSTTGCKWDDEGATCKKEEDVEETCANVCVTANCIQPKAGTFSNVKDGDGNVCCNVACTE
tara:strand:- start:258 stop:827 length:570 start_codon:yes stop_codon:yes gene_type:complete